MGGIRDLPEAERRAYYAQKRRESRARARAIAKLIIPPTEEEIKKYNLDRSNVQRVKRPTVDDLIPTFPPEGMITFAIPKAMFRKLPKWIRGRITPI